MPSDVKKMRGNSNYAWMRRRIVGVSRDTSKKATRRSSGGFTLFELIIVVTLVAIFSGILLGRFLRYQELAEKTAMEQTAGAIRSALNIQVATLVARGRTSEIPKLLSANPMTFMNDRQSNYAGEFYETRSGDIPPGNWYFDLRQKELVYLVFRDAHFKPDEKGEKSVRYKLALVNNEGPLTEPKREMPEIGGVILKLVTLYQWDIK